MSEKSREKITVFKGEVYYRYIKGETEEPIVETLRIIKVRRTAVTGLCNEKKIELTATELYNNYTLVNPDGYVTFTVACLADGNKDVVITLTRKEDGGNKCTMPYAVCRQAIGDVFTNQLIKDSSVFLVGTSVNKDNCPQNVEYKNVLSCNSIEYSRTIACYKYDTVDSLLSFIDTTKFDETLVKLYNKAPTVVQEANITLPVKGFCKTLRELMESNEFDYDFLYAFKINKVNFKLERHCDIDDSGSMIPTEKLCESQVKILEDIIGNYIFNTYIIPYDLDINFNDIQRNYIMICDTERMVYIIAYDLGEGLDRTECSMYNEIKNQLLHYKSVMEPIMAKAKNNHK
jgi:hypothetical protein